MLQAKKAVAILNERGAKSTNSKTRANCRQNIIHFVGSLFFRRETTISLNAVLYAYISPVSVLLLLRV